MDKRKVLSLSVDKVISEAVLKLDAVYAYFLASEYSQTNIYRGNISSLKYILKNHGTDTSGLTSEMTSVLDTYLKRFFTTVDVFVEVNTDNGVDVSIRVIDADGVETTLANSLNVINGKLDTYAAIENLLKK